MESWIDEYMKILAKHEGTRGVPAIEGGGYTRGYGLTDLAQSFMETKGANADSMSDKELAREYVIWNAEQIKNQFDNYDEWPDSVKMAAVDLAYNGGRITRYANFSRFLAEGKYQDAMKETLDIVTANDPKTSRSGALRGLGNRRFDIYNYVAEELNFPAITDLKVVKRGTGSLFSYTTADGATIDKAIGSPIHSASGKYDTVKKKTRPVDDIISPDDAMLEEVTKPPPSTPPVSEEIDIAPSEEVDLAPVEETVLSTVPPSAESRKERVSRISDAMFPESEQPSIQQTPDIQQPQEQTIDFPLPEGGSFESIFEVSKFGVGAEESFAVPNQHIHPPEVLAQAQAQRAAQATIDSPPKPDPVTKSDSLSPSIEAIKQEPNFNFIGKDRYGTPVESMLDDDRFDYHMFTPTEGQAFMAAMRQYNVLPALGRLLYSKTSPNMRAVEGYSVYNDTVLKNLVGEDGLYFFRHMGSHAQAMEKYRRLNQDYEDMMTVNMSPSGTGYSIISALLDPSILLPVIPTKIAGASRKHRFARGFMLGYATTGPQQAVIETQNESRDATNAILAVTAAGFLGGALSVGLGKAYSPAVIAEMRLNQDKMRTQLLGQKSLYTKEQIKELKAISSAGASISPELARTNAYRQLEQESLAETGFGIERLGWNPVNRMFKSENAIVRGLAPAMVDVGGLMQKKVSQEIAMEQSVETTFRTTFYPQLLEAVNEADLAYMAYRNKQVSSNAGMRALQMTGQRFMDGTASLFKRHDGSLSEVQFRARVGMAMRRNDLDPIQDVATPHVNRAAKAYRKVFEKVKSEANSVRLFEAEIAADIARATAKGDTVLVAELQQNLLRLRNEGVTVNTAASYLPRIYRIDRIERNVPRFLQIVRSWAMRSEGMSQRQADTFAAQVLDTVTRRRPFIDYEHATDALDWVKNPSGVQRRSLKIPDELLEEFLESDVEALVKSHVKTMGMDIELTRKFGSSSMDDLLKQVETEYQRLISETTDFTRRSELAEGLARDMRDIRGLRDRLRGTYGASKDPHALSSRFVRVMKSFNVLTGMGSAMISSIPDLARIAMVEGFQNAYGRGFATYFDQQAALVRTMAKPELEKAAVAVDAALGLRAHAMSDLGDLFGNRYAIERGLNDATGMFFLMNGLNIWNQVLKEIAGNVTMLRMTESIMKTGGWNRLTRSEKEKLLKNGIDQQSYGIMRMNIDRHGEKVGNEWLPNTEAWTDGTQRLRFRNALNQNVERIIVTPGAGDRALWTSTEMGSLLTQFKSYGQGAMVRMLTSGLQEKDGAFWQGAFLIVGLAALVNEIKRAQYGLESSESFDQKLINAIDRSGLLGYFTDVNNAIEKISDYKLGMRPFLTDQPSYPVHTGAKAGAVFGPSASASLNMTSILGDVLNGSVDAQTAKDLRFIFPTGNLPYLDPIYDGVFGEGNVNRQPEANRR